MRPFVSAWVTWPILLGIGHAVAEDWPAWRGPSRDAICRETGLLEQWPPDGRFDQPDRSDKNAWPHLVIANGMMYVRDQAVLLCYDVRAPGQR